MYDIVIIGAGIIGSMLAYDLSRYTLDIAIVEKNHDIANETTMANSAIIHTGYDPKENTLKALLNPIGAKRYPKICQDLSCAYKTIGSFVAACSLDEKSHLDILEKRAAQRDIACFRIDGDQARKQEPNLSDEVVDTLFFPETAVIYPWQIAQSCLEVALQNKAKLYLDSPVQNIEKTPQGFLVQLPDQTLQTKVVVNAAGLEAERITHFLEEPFFHMLPKRGEYFVLDQDSQVTDSIIFPVPTKKGKGVLCIPTVYGNTLVGPTSDLIEIQSETLESSNLVETSQAGLESVKIQAGKLVKNIPFHKVIRSFAGVRPSTDYGDFILQESQQNPGFILAAGIDSPGLASAPAISEYLIQNFISNHVPLQENPTSNMTLPSRVIMKDLSPQERQAKILENPLYGKIVCRCEQISEGEIVDCIHSLCGARSIKAVKKRVRPGMGRCQGGFCEPLVVEILARELGISPLEVVLDNLGSQPLMEENR